jgi:hypothetical protein
MQSSAAHTFSDISSLLEVFVQHGQTKAYAESLVAALKPTTGMLILIPRYHFVLELSRRIYSA